MKKEIVHKILIRKLTFLEYKFDPYKIPFCKKKILRLQEEENFVGHWLKDWKIDAATLEGYRYDAGRLKITRIQEGRKYRGTVRYRGIKRMNVDK